MLPHCFLRFRRLHRQTSLRRLEALVLQNRRRLKPIQLLRSTRFLQFRLRHRRHRQ